ncbi:tyrosine-type recombinase/integrase [Streptomyces sporangiiformans]|uniref:tyrosine-type recombinase/integrase n=1 Tax=Streptomyces sporangiiformans TaxID=2315329 RepID=UPI0023E29B36|nr:tyrosine-type recombinase/integrase [Streptomyces sporangiiformans]
MTRDDLAIDRNPVPSGLANRRRSGNRGARLLRTPRTLPRVLGPAEVEAVLGAVNTAWDRAMVLAMLLGGLRRCEVLGLRLGDLSPGERRVFISEGKGGHQRLIPVSAQFFSAVGGLPGPRGVRPSTTIACSWCCAGPPAADRSPPMVWTRFSMVSGSEQDYRG